MPFHKAITVMIEGHENVVTAFQRPHRSSPADSLLEAICLGSEWSWERVPREFRSEKLQATLSWLSRLLRGEEFQFYYLVILHKLEGRNERHLWYPSDEWRSGIRAEVFSDVIMSKGGVSLSVASCFLSPHSQILHQWGLS